MKYINEEKIEKIKLNKENFFVAMDFDKTITSLESVESWYATGNILGKEYQNGSDALTEKYEPIELDYNIDAKEKEKAMRQWYLEGLDLYYKFNLTKEKLKESVNISNLILREGAKEFFYQMHKNNIPVVIISAGIGNTIEQFLKNNNCYYDNMSLSANFFKFDEEGKIKKFSEDDLIFTSNKIINKQIDRKYRLLFGDIIEDKNIIPQNEWDKTISVGFLEKNIDKNLNAFKENFDIVLTEKDASFDVAKDIVLKEIY